MAKSRGSKEARLEATNRFRDKTYKSINIKLRLDEEEDVKVIESMEFAQEQGWSYRKWLYDLFWRADGGYWGYPPSVDNPGEK